ncbi:S1 family peptidase [Pengzhenrongella sicca]|uniref:Serine protease n=1 Tax=Pengzhenrongella sicca TaxID=2819238 RepID=A0A8A4ZC30_9MICO|nr:S1 family peptidase [Pengzhenrongella sicca]QTE29434.1 hypothetical protein J4E96_19590 [Pengzhenrongella sicca]
MDQAAARAIKRQLTGYVSELLAARVEASAARGTDAPSAAGVSLGLAPLPDGGFGVAVRYRLGVPAARMVARRVTEQVGPTVDVRRTGRISPLAQRVAGPRPPVVTARAAGETGRVRPLRPGVSIANVAVTAGTLGAFVRVDGLVHALSNYHVLVGSPAGTVGDAVLQPGPADGGRDPRDRVGALAAFAPLEAGRTALVDAAVARLADPVVDLDYPAGPITTTAVVLGAEEVEKIGRTTGVTRGRVTAIELDDVVVGYGDGLGELRFDDQIEVEGIGAGAFSRGGDSGSLVYRVGEAGGTGGAAAVGLLFAGSETGGENGTGLTYVNPIRTVLDLLGAELVG